MGGLVGILCKERISDKIIEPLVQEMMSHVVHRGPDQARVTYIEFGALGYQRLCIVDPEDGWQPFTHPEKPLVIVFDGEIYNYAELRQQLILKGVELRSKSDTEVILMLYDQIGPAVFDQLHGTYALAIWDGEKQELFLARDPMGHKPLYYEVDDVGISFASELSALLSVRVTKPELNPVAVQYVLALQYLPAPMTMFENVYKLPPGYHVRWRTGDGLYDMNPHWNPDKQLQELIERNRNISMSDAVADFESRFQKVVKEQIQYTDMPIGVLMGGGLNSAILADMMKKNVKYPLHTFSVGFSECDPQYNELRQVRKLSRELNTVNHEVIVGPQIMTELPMFLWQMDEPIADPALLPLAAMANQAQEHVKILMTGHGANELFGGYDYYSQLDRMLGISKYPSFVRTMMSPMTGRIQASKEEDAHWNTPAQLITSGAHPLAVWQTYRNFPERERQRLMPRSEIIPDSLMPFYCQNKLDPFTQLQWTEAMRFLPDNTLMGLDKAMMTHSMEARTPFTDPQLALWALSLPSELKATRNEAKSILRHYAEPYLPKAAVKRPHQALAMPLAEWLYPHLPDIEISLLRSALVQETKLFSPSYIQAMLLQLNYGEITNIQPLWNLIVLKTWYDVFVKCEKKSDIRTLQALSRNF